MLKQIQNLLIRLDRDERGDIPVGPLLIIGLIAIPLVIALIAFGDAIIEWLTEKWGEVTGAQDVKSF